MIKDPVENLKLSEAVNCHKRTMIASPRVNGSVATNNTKSKPQLTDEQRSANNFWFAPQHPYYLKFFASEASDTAKEKMKTGEGETWDTLQLCPEFTMQDKTANHNAIIPAVGVRSDGTHDFVLVVASTPLSEKNSLASAFPSPQTSVSRVFHFGHSYGKALLSVCESKPLPGLIPETGGAFKKPTEFEISKSVKMIASWFQQARDAALTAKCIISGKELKAKLAGKINSMQVAVVCTIKEFDWDEALGAETDVQHQFFMRQLNGEKSTTSENAQHVLKMAFIRMAETKQLSLPKKFTLPPVKPKPKPLSKSSATHDESTSTKQQGTQQEGAEKNKSTNSPNNITKPSKPTNESLKRGRDEKISKQDTASKSQNPKSTASTLSSSSARKLARKMVATQAGEKDEDNDDDDDDDDSESEESDDSQQSKNTDDSSVSSFKKKPSGRKVTDSASDSDQGLDSEDDPKDSDEESEEEEEEESESEEEEESESESSDESTHRRNKKKKKKESPPIRRLKPAREVTSKLLEEWREESVGKLAASSVEIKTAGITYGVPGNRLSSVWKEHEKKTNQLQRSADKLEEEVDLLIQDSPAEIKALDCVFDTLTALTDVANSWNKPC